MMSAEPIGPSKGDITLSIMIILTIYLLRMTSAEQHLVDELPTVLSREERRLHWASAASHGSALIASKIALAPLDRFKLVLQTTRPGDRGITGFSIRNCWRGCSSHLAFVSVAQSVRMWTVTTRQTAWEDGKLLKHGNLFFLNCFGSATALFVAYPWDVSFTKKALAGFHAAGVPGPTLISRMGAAYQGLPLALSTIPIFTATTMIALSGFQKMAPEDVQKFPYNVFAGASAGVLGSLAVYPLDTARRRLIAIGENSPGFFGAYKFPGAYRGAWIQVLKAIPEYAIFAAVYSKVIGLDYI